jgi:hypothetical protein
MKKRGFPEEIHVFFFILAVVVQKLKFLNNSNSRFKSQCRDCSTAACPRLSCAFRVWRSFAPERETPSSRQDAAASCRLK